MSFGWLSRLPGRARALFSFPLLAKELTETAARPRTFVMRVLYAMALYAGFALVVPREIWNPSNVEWYRVLGVGAEMFRSLIGVQYFGILLFLPALMCGRITQEKERDSLVLLFLTELGPWSIILQKYVGGLVPMLSCFLLALPLAGVAYAFGGLNGGDLLPLLGALLLMCLQIGALALLCSAWCRSTVGAFLATYLGIAILYAGPWILTFSIYLLFSIQNSRIEAEWFMYAFFPPAIINRLRYPAGVSWIVTLAPMVLSVPLFLLLARGFLVRRAFVPPSNFLRRLFGRIDAFMKRMNRATGGIVFWHNPNDLPTDRPVFWRETNRRVLGKPHYLIRVLYALEIPTLFLGTMVALAKSGYYTQYYLVSVYLAILAAMAALMVSVQAANTIVSERIGQTLEVLLTTPLSAREIIRQKEQALWRLLLVIAIPLITVMVCEASLELDLSWRRIGQWLPYLTCGVLMVVIYLPMIAWLSLWISLRVRTRFQAIIGAVGALTVWVALGPLLFFLLDRFAMHENGIASFWHFAVLLSPVSAGYLNEVSEMNYLWFPGGAWPVTILNGMLYTVIALFIRWRLFADAENFLRR